MTVRIYCPLFPYPFSEAAFQTMFNQATALVRLGCAVEMVVWKNGVQDAVKALQKAPDEILSAGFSVRFFSRFGDVSAVYTLGRLKTLAREPDASGAAGAESDRQFKRVLRALASGYASPELYYYPPELDRRAEIPPVDVEIYHYSFSYVWLKSPKAPPESAEASSKKPRRIIHFHNLECDVFRARAAEERSLSKRIVHLVNAGRLDRHERELSKLVDEIGQHSPVDVNDYKLRTGFTAQRALPPTMSREQFERRRSYFLEQTKAAAGPMRIGFVGGLDFEPNRSSAAWILREVAPQLRDAGFQGELVFAGKGPPPGWLDQFSKFEFVKFLGFVPSLEDFWASLSFLLVPHITGGGVRLKLLEALGSALPVLANQAAVRRLVPEVRSSPLLFVSDSPTDWARQILAEKPFATRRNLIDTPFCEGIDGEKLYRFLAGGS